MDSSSQIPQNDISTEESIAEILDTGYRNLLFGDAKTATDKIAISLRSLVNTVSEDRWRSEICPTCAAHPVMDLLMEDPYTRRARQKPRGYAGDAVMMDYLYFQSPPVDTTPLGRTIFSVTTGTQNGRSVRERMKLLASCIDETANRIVQPSILSVACGHLREAELCTALSEGRLSKIIAMDQDPMSLDVVKSTYHAAPVECVSGSVKSIIDGRLSFSEIDFCYSAGLYDYLPELPAQTLTGRLFTMLQQGGELLIGNFLPDTHGRAYMEAFMDWHLVVRSPREIQNLAKLIPAAEISSTSYFEDANHTIGYLKLTKAHG